MFASIEAAYARAGCAFGSPNRFHRVWQRYAPLFAGSFGLCLLAGCSIHPLPDDVSPIPTENIIASARCEARLGLAEAIESYFRDQGITGFDPNRLADDLPRMKQLYGRDPLWAARIKDYEDFLKIGVAYDWRFEITEKDNADGAFNFKLPFVHPGLFDLTGSAFLHKTRLAKRTFKTGDTFAVLLKQDYYDFCRGDPSQVAANSIPVGPIPRDPNILYPITGSIGLRKVINTFLSIDSQGGAGESFVDELTFTTEVSGTVNPSITLAPMTHSFRLASANVTLNASRLDIHMVTISLVKPNSGSDAAADGAGAKTAQAKKGAQSKVAKKSSGATDDEADSDKKVQVTVINSPDSAAIDRQVLREGYRLSPLWRARYNLCVQDGRTREDELKTLRLTAPEVYCIESTDTFVPRNGGSGYYGNLPRRRFR